LYRVPRASFAGALAHAVDVRWLADGRDVYVYFNNDGGGGAVWDALRLREFLRARLDAARPAETGRWRPLRAA
jgi:uncharacterized protein YecE (DUF72 family)